MILKIKNEQGKFVDVPAIKGDAFTYDDFTPEQLEKLKGEKPVKGKDYFTQEDVDDMVEEVYNKIDPSTTGKIIWGTIE